MLAGIVDVQVFRNLDLKWADRAGTVHRPDFMAVYGLRAAPNWTMLRVRDDDVGPQFIIEVTSQSTVENDYNDKLAECALFGVKWFLIIDLHALTTTGAIARRLFHLFGDTFRIVAPVADGQPWLEPPRTWSAARDGIVECFGANNRPILAPEAEHAARAAAEARRSRGASAKRKPNWRKCWHACASVRQIRHDAMKCDCDFPGRRRD